jgi:hypothetical protein
MGLEISGCFWIFMADALATYVVGVFGARIAYPLRSIIVLISLARFGISDVNELIFHTIFANVAADGLLRLLVRCAPNYWIEDVGWGMIVSMRIAEDSEIDITNGYAAVPRQFMAAINTLETSRTHILIKSNCVEF